jgi:hypothetical protein
VVRGATLDCGLLVVVAVDVVEVLLAALLLLEGEPHPTKPMPKAVMTIATALIAAIRFIQIVPVDQAAWLDHTVGEHSSTRACS